MIPQGKSVLIKFASLQGIEKYVQVVYLQEGNQNHAYFQIQYVHIKISDENISCFKHLSEIHGSHKTTKAQSENLKVIGV